MGDENILKPHSISFIERLFTVLNISVVSVSSEKVMSYGVLEWL